ncbi:hypothetical protein FGB62_331g03 [Gracilaria domingensis]|nr:hypothetical protein FGB62_331g03 [Gracilaria domingensis]
MVTEIKGDDDLQRTDKRVPVYDIGSPSFAGGEGPRRFAVITRRIKEAIKASYNSVTRNLSSPGIQSFEDKNGQCRAGKREDPTTQGRIHWWESTERGKRKAA